MAPSLPDIKIAQESSSLDCKNIYGRRSLIENDSTIPSMGRARFHYVTLAIKIEFGIQRSTTDPNHEHSYVRTRTLNHNDYIRYAFY